MRKVSSGDISSLSKEDMMRIFSRCMNVADCAKLMKVSKKVWIAQWKELKLPNPKITTFKEADEDLPGYNEVAIVSDFHFGSFWQQKTLLNEFVEQCRNRGIDSILCAGDITDGLMSWPTHEKERFLHSAESFEEYVEDWYPKEFKLNGFILGNHDTSLSLLEGDSYDFGRALIARRKDLIYHQQDDSKISRAFILPGGVPATMYHGSGSCSNPMMKQNREYRLQSKVLEMLGDGADSSSLWVFGHCHKTAITSFMGNVIVGVPCFQSDTPYCINRGSKGDIGGTIISYNEIDGHIIRVSVEWILQDLLNGIRERDF
jgi:hypothetical protein